MYWFVRCMCHVSHTLSYELSPPPTPDAMAFGTVHQLIMVCVQDGIQQLGMHIDLTGRSQGHH